MEISHSLWFLATNFLRFIAFLTLSDIFVPSITNAQEIQILVLADRSFSPQDIQANVGDRITWINTTGVRHEILFSDNPTNTGDQHLHYILTSHRKISIVVTKAGKFDYVCRWHSMWGSIHIDKLPVR